LFPLCSHPSEVWGSWMLPNLYTLSSIFKHFEFSGVIRKGKCYLYFRCPCCALEVQITSPKKKTPWPPKELGSSKQTRKSWLSTGLHVCIPESLPRRATRILISYTFWPRWWVSSLTCPKRRGISVFSHKGKYFPNIDQSKYLTRT